MWDPQKNKKSTFFLMTPFYWDIFDIVMHSSNSTFWSMERAKKSNMTPSRQQKKFSLNAIPEVMYLPIKKLANTDICGLNTGNFIITSLLITDQQGIGKSNKKSIGFFRDIKPSLFPSTPKCSADLVRQIEVSLIQAVLSFERSSLFALVKLSSSAPATSLVATNLPGIDSVSLLLDTRLSKRSESVTTAASSNSTGVTVTASSSTSSSAASTSFVYPSAFDTSLGNNFTNASCSSFFNDFLANESFSNCLPMSFFLETSKSYVTLVREGPSMLEYLLNASCSVDFDQCKNVMGDLQRNLLLESNCYNDFKLGNPSVTTAYNDFASYSVVREATCLANTSSASNSTHYCYSDALYNYNDSSDAYLYLLPLGDTFPNNSIPSCSSCTSRLMNIYYAATGNSSSPISYTYDSAASIIDNYCSNSFVPSRAKAIPSAKKSSAASAYSPTSLTNVLLFFSLVLPVLIM